MAIYKKRMLVLASTYPRWRNDTEPSFVHELCKRLVNDFDVHVICPSAFGSATFEEMDGVFVHRFRYSIHRWETIVAGGGIVSNLRRFRWKWLLLPCFLLGMFIQTAIMIQKLKPELLHVHWIIPQGVMIIFLRLFMRLPPVILTSHGGDLFTLNSKLMLKLKRWIVKRVELVTVVSEAMLSPARKLGIPDDKLKVIPMGVDFSSTFKTNANITRNFGEILFVGRLVDKKGIIHLIEALPYVCNRIPDARLFIVGRGPSERILVNLAVSLGVRERIEFVGAISHPELPKFYQRASLFVAPFVKTTSGDEEGLGLVTIEAIACGCPVLVGNVAAVRDVFGNIDAPQVVDPRNTRDFSSKIVNCLLGKIDYEPLILRKSVEKAFSWDNVAKRYKHAISSLLVS